MAPPSFALCAFAARMGHQLSVRAKASSAATDLMMGIGILSALERATHGGDDVGR
jgi:hypothetical protein